MSHLDIFYFAYGSNMNQRQMKERCPDSVLIGRAYLGDYTLSFTISSPMRWGGGGCADIVPSPGARVWGLIYKISETDLGRLDHAEGPRYRRFLTSAIRDNGTTVNVYAYEVIEKAPSKKPAPAYLEIMKNAAREFSFPQEYQTFLESIELKD